MMNTVGNVEKLLGITRHSLRQMLNKGRIPGCRRPAAAKWHLLTLEEIEIIRQFVQPK